jgi:hypothetical protein
VWEHRWRLLAIAALVLAPVVLLGVVTALR